MKVLKDKMGLVGDGITLSEDDFEVEAVVTPTYVDAIKSHKKVKKELDNRFKDQEKGKEAFIKMNHNQNVKPKGTKDMKKMKLSESIFDDAVAAMSRPSTGTLYYKTHKRGCLADVIQDELTCGEEVYKRGSNGKAIPTVAPSLNLEEWDIGVSSDENGEYIIANVSDEATQRDVEEIAMKYGKSYKSGKNSYVADDKVFYTKIYIDDEDWVAPFAGLDSQPKWSSKQVAYA